MNRFVHEHYPVEKLPEDLREGRLPGDRVTITIDDENGNEKTAADLHAQIAEILRNPQPMTIAQARALAGPRDTTPEEAVARVRALRDEWDQ